jgi:transposase
MSTRKQKDCDDLRLSNPHAAGIDVHAAIHWVAVPPGHAPPALPDHPPNLPAHVRSFGACTADLIRLADWLKRCGVTTVAMESTGVYWIPLFGLLESRGFEVFLVDPRQSPQAPGRANNEVGDCQWLQRLHGYGLLTASFRPAEQVVVLRSYLRQRQMLLRYAGQHVQHMQKTLEQMNVKLAEVVSDITGVTGMAILGAILAGQRDPLELAKLRNDKCKRTQAEIARALQGNWRTEHLFALKQAVELHRFYRRQLAQCDAEVLAQVRTFADRGEGQPRPDPQRRRRSPKKANDLDHEGRVDRQRNRRPRRHSERRC